MTPKIYVACLASYNKGKLHGRWIDADQDEEQVMTEIQDMLRSSPEPGAGDWAIHDYEGFCGVHIRENELIESVARLAALIVKHGPAFAAYYNARVGDLDYAEDTFEEAYQGEYGSEEEFAESICSGISMPDFLLPYIDYKKMADDMLMNDYFSVKHDGKIYIFQHI